MKPSTSLGTRSNVGIAKPSPAVRQTGNMRCLLVMGGVYRSSVLSGGTQVKYRCRCRVKPLRSSLGLAYSIVMETPRALPHDLWEQLPPAAQAYIEALEARVETLASMVDALEEQVRILQEQLNQTSRN